jgi:hypothetical protein
MVTVYRSWTLLFPFSTSRFERETPVTNPYLEPVASSWARAAGALLLVAAVTLTAWLAYQLYDLIVAHEARRTFNSSSLLFGLVLVALCGMCWQAGYRLAFGRAGGAGTLFSRPAWFAIGIGLTTITALMAYAILRSRSLTLLDAQVILFLGGIGVWCIVLAFRR